MTIIHSKLRRLFNREVKTDNLKKMVTLSSRTLAGGLLGLFLTFPFVRGEITRIYSLYIPRDLMRQSINFSSTANFGQCSFWGGLISHITPPNNKLSHSFTMVDRFPSTSGFNEQEGGNEVTQQFLAPRIDAAWINAQLSHLAATAANAQKQSQGQDTVTTVSGGTSSSMVNKDGVQRQNVSGGFPLPKKWGEVSRDTSATFFSHIQAPRSTTPFIIHSHINPPSSRKNAFPLPKLNGQNRLVCKKPMLLSYKLLWDRCNPEIRKSFLELQMQRSRVKIESHNLRMNYHRENTRQNFEVLRQSMNVGDQEAMVGHQNANSNDVQNEHGTTPWAV
jgi:hypothetical protein